MRKTVDILGIPVDSITMQEAVDKVCHFLDEDSVHTIYTPNAEIMMEAQRDAELKQILRNADMLVADGAGVVLASRILRCSVPEKVSGIDLVNETFRILAQRRTRYFLLGSKPGIVEAAAVNITGQYPGIEIVGFNNGYYAKEDEDKIIDQINSSGTEILLVALGAPKQEKWISQNRDKLKIKICIGVGGTLDILAGKAELAPEFFRKNGLEWLFRLYKEPRRAKRMLDLPRFILHVIWNRITEYKS